MGSSTFIVAEISANHGKDINIVKKSIKKAKEIGCNAVKIQTYRPDTITLDCDNEYFRLDTGTIWDGQTLYDLYSDAYLPWEWHKELFEYAENENIVLFSTPFDFSSVDLLEKCNNPIYKIASFEIMDIPLIEYAASKGKPMIISAGIATENEIVEAIDACRRQGNNDITILKCTSQYPAKLEDANLVMINDMKKRFDVKVGLSDHTEGDIAAIVAVAMGAEVIEKHFIIDKNIGGPDSSFSMVPDDFKNMILHIRKAEKTLGEIDYNLSEKQIKSRKYSRSLFVVEDVKKGDRITDQNVKSIRPEGGLKPKYYKTVAGRYFNRDVKRGIPLTADMISDIIDDIK